MKTQSFFLVLMAMIFSVGVQAQTNIQHMEAMIPKDADKIYEDVNSFFTALVVGDFDKAQSYLHKDFVIIGAAPDSMNAAGYLDLWRSYHAEATDLAIVDGYLTPIEFKEGLNNGKAALIWGAATWTPKTTKTPVYSWMHAAVSFQDKKIRRIYYFEDNLAVMMQMGYSLVPPSSGK